LLANLGPINERFSNCPTSLKALAVEYAPHAKEYFELRAPPSVTGVGKGRYLVDLLAHKSFLNKCYIGLVAGTFLTIRARDTGRIEECPLCKVSATQEHFLDRCSVNVSPREVLSTSVPSGVIVEHLAAGRVSAFYREIRKLRITTSERDGGDAEFPVDAYSRLAKAASSMAMQFTSNTLSMFKEMEDSQVLRCEPEP